MGILLDLAIVITIILYIVIYAKKGFVKSLVIFVGNIASVILASIISRPVSKFAFDTFFRNKMIESVSGKMMETGIPAGIDQAVDQSVSALPEFIQNFIDLFGGDIDLNNISITQNVPEFSSMLVDEIVAPIVISLIQIIVFFILFFIFIYLVKVIAKVTNIVKKVPVVGQLNKFLGAALGFLCGIITIFLVLFFFRLILPYIDIDKEFLDSTIIFKWLLYDNPVIKLF
jgi:Colicin V production protein.